MTHKCQHFRTYPLPIAVLTNQLDSAKTRSAPNDLSAWSKNLAGSATSHCSIAPSLATTFVCAACMDAVHKSIPVARSALFKARRSGRRREKDDEWREARRKRQNVQRRSTNLDAGEVPER